MNKISFFSLLFSLLGTGSCWSIYIFRKKKENRRRGWAWAVLCGPSQSSDNRDQTSIRSMMTACMTVFSTWPPPPPMEHGGDKGDYFNFAYFYLRSWILFTHLSVLLHLASALQMCRETITWHLGINESRGHFSPSSSAYPVLGQDAM